MRPSFTRLTIPLCWALSYSRGVVALCSLAGWHGFTTRQTTEAHKKGELGANFMHGFPREEWRIKRARCVVACIYIYIYI